MSNMMLTEVSFIDSAILHSHTFGHTTTLSTCIRPNNINHQEKRHHSRKGVPTKAQHKASKEIQCRSKKYSVQGSKSLPRKVCQDLGLQYLFQVPLPSKWASTIKESQEIISLLVIRLLMFHVWGAPTQLVKRRRWRGRSRKCQQPSLSMISP